MRTNVDSRGFVRKNSYGEDVGRVVVGGHELFGDELANLLQGFRNELPFESVRLIACH